MHSGWVSANLSLKMAATATKRFRRRPHLSHCVKVFLSYAHEDEKLRAELGKHLSPLRRSKLIDSWCDRKLVPGSHLDDEIVTQLRTSDLVLLLISPDFINSEYCYSREMRVALRRHVRGEVRVIPVILRPVDWLKTPIGKLLALPSDAKPVTTWNRRDEALLDIARGVRRAAEAILSGEVALRERPQSNEKKRPRKVHASSQKVYVP